MIQSAIYKIKRILTASEIKNSGSTGVPISELPSSGTDGYYNVRRFDCFLNFGTTQFDSTTILGVKNISVATYQMISEIVQASYDGALKGINNPLGGEVAVNDSLEIRGDNDSLLGDSTITCYIEIEKIML